ncbi:5' nucleotidase, NT5C type [Methylobacterium sp. sgz302541]|uniref:5' nucleotidase, NT5C type n=1 Tax=unclassified Methylobacterium TaxID=2615210 RepID=UPI003D34A290
MTKNDATPASSVEALARHLALEHVEQNDALAEYDWHASDAVWKTGFRDKACRYLTAALGAGASAASTGPEPTRRLYLDLDGVMADFDAHFPAVFGLDHRGMADDAMWKTINAHPSYFRDMPPCAGAIAFFRSIEHLRPIILTACPRTNYPHVARQKRAWVREHLSEHVTVLPVLGGRNKPLFMQEPGDVLIDDWDRNTEAWEKAGGVAILHRDFEATAAALVGLFDVAPAALAAEPDAGARDKLAEIETLVDALLCASTSLEETYRNYSLGSQEAALERKIEARDALISAISVATFAPTPRPEPTPRPVEVERLREERSAICRELGCIEMPGIPLSFVQDLRRQLTKAHARNGELIRSWDPATPTERQELDRMRRGWGPSSPTERERRRQDVAACLQALSTAMTNLSVGEDEDVPEEAQDRLDLAYERVSQQHTKVVEILRVLVADPKEWPDIVAAEERGAARALSAAQGDQSEKPEVSTFSHWTTNDLAAQCRMQSREMLDPELSRFFTAVSERLLTLSATQGDQPAGDA